MLHFGKIPKKFGESFPTSIYLQNLASIQPRTSPNKFVSSSSRESEFEIWNFKALICNPGKVSQLYQLCAVCVQPDVEPEEVQVQKPVLVLVLRLPSLNGVRPVGFDGRLDQRQAIFLGPSKALLAGFGVAPKKWSTEFDISVSKSSRTYKSLDSSFLRAAHDTSKSFRRDH